ncbi:MAG: hypothetical protein OXS32_02665 [Verrucomicrobiales bacterium]|nr:hypothetical protein [Verrucomicrobiales bacterium]
MNENEIQLKVQALVDGVLTGREAEELQQRINNDATLQQLHERLTQMRGLIANSELPRPLPESGDFYWNKIAESIEREERAGERIAKPTPANRWLLRWLAPLAGVSTVVLLLTLQQPTAPDLGITLSSDHELELSSDEIDVMTYNSDDDSMSIVWLDYSMDIQKDYMELWLD